MGAGRFERDDVLFSLCGLNCSLCPMFVQGSCAGCRAGSWCAQNCKIAPCSVRHGGVDYCFECPEYPCEKYDGVDQRDSLISHRNQLTDMAKAKRIGLEAYRDEQREKARLLHQLLDGFDNGRHVVFFCLAANMLAVDDLKAALGQIAEQAAGLPPTKRGDIAEHVLREVAAAKDVPLKLRTWDGPWE